MTPLFSQRNCRGFSKDRRVRSGAPPFVSPVYWRRLRPSRSMARPNPSPVVLSHQAINGIAGYCSVKSNSDGGSS